MLRNILKRVDSETTADNGVAGPRPHDAVPLLQQVESKRLQLESILQIRADTLSKLDAQAASAEEELEKAKAKARAFCDAFLGDPVEIHRENTVTLVPTKEQEQEWHQRKWEG